MITTKKCRHGKFTFFDNDIIIGKSLNVYGEYCEWEIMCLEQIIEPDWHIADIGANIGTHTVPFTRLAHKGHVHAFEPNEYSRGLLERNLLDNKVTNATVFPYALSRSAGNRYLSNYNPQKPGNYGESSLNTSGEYMELVPTMRLDQMQFTRLDLLKVDVEGEELAVFKGAKHTLAKHLPSVFVECNDETHLTHIYTRFKKLGYEKMYWCPVRNFNPDNYNNFEKNIFGSSGVINLLVISPKINVKFEYLEPVLDENDSYKKMYARVSNDLTKANKLL
jgi:FkbM family methyltransferase